MLNYSNIANHANYKGSAFGASGGISANFETPLGDKGIVQSNKRVKDENGNQVLATGAESLQAGMNLGYGSDSDSQSSQTKSGINTQNIIIRDEQAQIERTGKTAEQIKAEIKTDITTDTAEKRSGKLDNNFDKAKLEKELDYQVKATKEFQSITRASISEKISSQAESKRQEAEQAKQAGDLAKASELEKEAEKWETGGTYRQGVDAITNAVGLALGGSPTEGVVAGAVSPYMNTVIKEATTNENGEVNKPANLLAHAVLGAIEAKATGNNALAGAVAGATGEGTAMIVKDFLYKDKETKDLTESEKQNVVVLSQIASGVAGGVVGDSSSNAIVGGEIGKRAVENNYFKAQQIKSWLKSYQNADDEDKEALLIDRLNQIDIKQNEQALNTKITKEQLAKEEVYLKELLNDPECLEKCRSLANYSISQLQYFQQNYDIFLKEKAINSGIGMAAGYATLGIGRMAVNSPIVKSYLVNVPYKEKIVGAGLAMGANASYQQYRNGEINSSDVLWTGGTAFVSTGTSFLKMNAINAGSATTKAYLEEKSLTEAGVSSVVASSLGYGVGKTFESVSNRIINREYFKDKTKFEYEPIRPYPEYPFISTYKKLNSMPSTLGNSVDAISSEVIGDKINNRDEYRNGTKEWRSNEK